MDELRPQPIAFGLHVLIDEAEMFQGREMAVDLRLGLAELVGERGTQALRIETIGEPVQVVIADNRDLDRESMYRSLLDRRRTDVLAEKVPADAPQPRTGCAAYPVEPVLVFDRDGEVFLTLRDRSGWDSDRTAG